MTSDATNRLLALLERVEAERERRQAAEHALRLIVADPASAVEIAREHLDRWAGR